MLIVNSDDFHFGPCPIDPRSPSYNQKNYSEVLTDSPLTTRITYGTYLHESLWRSEILWDYENHSDYRFEAIDPAKEILGKDNGTGSVAVPEMRYGTLHKGLLCDEYGDWNHCTLRSYLITDLRRIGRAEAIRRRMVSPNSKDSHQDTIREERRKIAEVVSEPVQSLFESLYEILISSSKSSNDNNVLHEAADIGIYQFIRSNVFWVDLISKVRAIPNTQKSRATAYPKSIECGHLLPLWQLILVRDQLNGEVTEVVQVVPYAEGRSLLRLSGRSYLRPLYPPEAIESFAKTLSRTLLKMHQCGYCHRDVTPTNVLLTCTSGNPPGEDDVIDANGKYWTPVLADFESLLPLTMSGPEGGWSLGWNGGTRGFSTPPEAFDSSFSISNNPHWGVSWDLWGLGSTCFALLWGRAPFWGDSADEVSKKIMEMTYSHPAIVFDDDERTGESLVASCDSTNDTPNVGSAQSGSTVASEISQCDCVIRHPAPSIPSKSAKVATYRRMCKICLNAMKRIQNEYVDQLLIRDTYKRAQWVLENSDI